jgi:hypothetical protein
MRMVRPSLYRIDQRRDGLATEQKAQRLQGYRRNGKSGQYYTDRTPASVLVLRACYVDFNPRILKVAMLNGNGTLRARLFIAGRE